MSREALMQQRHQMLDHFLCGRVKAEADYILYDSHPYRYQSATYYSAFINALNQSAKAYWMTHFTQVLPKATPKALAKEFASLATYEIPHLDELSCPQAIADFRGNLAYRDAHGPLQRTFWQKLKHDWQKD